MCHALNSTVASVDEDDDARLRYLGVVASTICAEARRGQQSAVSSNRQETRTNIVTERLHYASADEKLQERPENR